MQKFSPALRRVMLQDLRRHERGVRRAVQRQNGKSLALLVDEPGDR